MTTFYICLGAFAVWAVGYILMKAGKKIQMQQAEVVMLHLYLERCDDLLIKVEDLSYLDDDLADEISLCRYSISQVTSQDAYTRHMKALRRKEM